MYAIILAGGTGSRLWPMSRDLYPKQFIALNGNNSLLQSTVKRLKNIVRDDKILCITNIKLANDVKFQLAQINSNAVVIAEPMVKNTAPAIACAVQYIKNISNSDEEILVLPSDHLIKDTEAFENTIKKAQILAEEEYIVTCGVKPSYAETGYGYIQTSDELKNGYKIKTFVEKPDETAAEKYIEAKNVFWNSGIFCAKTSVWEQEIKKYAPEIFENVKKLDCSQALSIPYNIYENMPDISIDYAVMEKSPKAAMVVMESDWNDLGSWKSLYEVKEKDNNGNVIEGNVIANNVKNSLIYSDKKLVAVSGLEDIILVETEDAVMACKKEEAQDVKKLYNKLAQNNLSVKTVHKTVFRPWGYYTCLADGDGYLTKLISVSPKQKLSVQSHNHRSEHWVVLEGEALVVLDGKNYELHAGQSIDIPLKAIHSLQNPYNKELRIIEVQKGDYISEDDIIRYEDVYGRV